MFSHLCQSVYGIQTTHIHTGGDQSSSRLFPPSTSWTAKALPDWCCVDTCPANNCSHCMFTYVNVGHTFQTNHGRTKYLNAELVSFILDCSCSTSIVLPFRVIRMHLRLNALEVDDIKWQMHIVWGVLVYQQPLASLLLTQYSLAYLGMTTCSEPI